MPLFVIANAQFFQYPLFSLRARIPYDGKLPSVSFAFGNEHSAACAWKSLDKLEKVKFDVGGVDLGRCRPMIKAIATTLEPKSLTAKGDECLGSEDMELGISLNSHEVLLESCSEESGELDEKERLRRMKISKANKGQTAWNKGRKHSAETLRKIKERTKLAMQNPKIKMKLAKVRHPQTLETKQKIGAGVKMRCKRKHERKVVQETCYFEWQNLIAEASRRGYVNQKELQWNSYEILNEQLEQEWLACVKEGKQIPRPPSSRAPKTPEHRRKIAEAIAAKWADPEYARKVCSAKTNLHGTERKPRRPISTQSKKSNHIVKMNANTNINVKSDTDVLNQIKLKKINSPPTYRDPLASSKLDMIKTVRVQRAAADTELIKAIEQARLLIAEAEKAAKALEVVATKSPVARASLIETRQLIAEAIQSLESISVHKQGITMSHVPVASIEVNKLKDAECDVVGQSQNDPVNGHGTLSSSDYKSFKDLGKFSSFKIVNGDSNLHPTSIDRSASVSVGYNSNIEASSSSNQQRETEQDQTSEYKTDPSWTTARIPSIKTETQPRPPIVTKKWVCGRFVEVVKE